MTTSVEETDSKFLSDEEYHRIHMMDAGEFAELSEELKTKYEFTQMWNFDKRVGGSNQNIGDLRVNGMSPAEFTDYRRSVENQTPARPRGDAAMSVEVGETVGATGILPKKVNVVSDWDDLKSVIVGRSDNDVLPAWYPSFTDPDGNEVAGPDTAGVSKLEFNHKMQRRCIKQQDDLCELLEKEGVQVFRPSLLSPETAHADPVGLSQAWVREVFAVFGNKIVVGQMRTPHRNKDIQALEPLFKSIEQAGLATVHRLPPCTFERNEDWVNDSRPFLEGGDVFRLGKDVLVTLSYLASSGAGYGWLSDLLSPDGVDVWPAYLTQDWEHGDYIFMPVREGLCVAHLPAFVDGLLPSPCTDWDVVSITRDEADNKFAANGVVLRYNLVLMPTGCPRVVRALEKKGVDVIEVPFDGPTFWQGAIDCSVSELWRQRP